MLPPFIIEQIRRREEEDRVAQRPVLELPLPEAPPGARSRDELEENEPQRGVLIIEL